MSPFFHHKNLIIENSIWAIHGSCTVSATQFLCPVFQSKQVIKAAFLFVYQCRPGGICSSCRSLLNGETMITFPWNSTMWHSSWNIAHCPKYLHQLTIDINKVMTKKIFNSSLIWYKNMLQWDRNWEVIIDWRQALKERFHVIYFPKFQNPDLSNGILWKCNFNRVTSFSYPCIHMIKQ